MSKLAKTLLSAACLTMLANTAAASETPELRIENFIGTINVVTGDYDKVTVTDADGAAYESKGASVFIDDGQTIENLRCKSSNSSVKISIGKWNYRKRKGGYKNLNEYPKLKIKAPRDTHIVINDAVIFGDIEEIGSADIHLTSCGELDFGDVNGAFDVRISGSADVTASNTGALNLSITGSGDFTAQDVAEAKVNVIGSGDIEIANIHGAASVESRGSGDVIIEDINGRFDYDGVGSGDLEIGNIAGAADIHTAGSGDVDMERVEGALTYTSGGSGDFETDYVGGESLSAKIGGSGDAQIGDGNVNDLYIKVGGSGSVDYDGGAVDAELITRGSGSIVINDPSGKLRKSKSGSGSIRVR